MIKRTYNAEFINSVINHPSVIEGTELKELADVSAIAADLRNHILVNEFGGFLVIKAMEGVYECHTQFLPEGRGQLAVEAVQEAMRYMFLETDCQRIITKVNVNNKAVRLFAGQFFKKRGTNGTHDYYSLDLDNWIEKDDHCRIKGRLFHAQIDDDVEHSDDPIHNSFVGAAILMAQANNIYKGQLAYNRWAVMAGYEPIIILSETPIIAKCGNLRIAIQNSGVTLCR
jgi:transcriptional regulator of aromatic amino acid metabolism